MDGLVFPTTAKVLGDLFGADLIGEPTRPVEKLAALSGARGGCLSYCASARFADEIDSEGGAVIFTRREWVQDGKPHTYLVVADPKAVFAEVAKRFAAQWSTPAGISQLASVAADAVLGADVTIAPFAVIESGATIGAASFIGAHTVIGAHSAIGEKSVLHPRVVVFPKVKIGNRVTIFSGTVIGADGFGIFGQPASLTQMPQIGTVIIEDDVRVGANCTIDRATLGETRLESGVKIDNLVHIAHNCTIRKNSIVCAQAGIAGSSTIGAGSILGGQVGISNGVSLGENIRMGAQSGISIDLPGDQTYAGSPAIPVREAHQLYRNSRKLSDLFKRVRSLEKKGEDSDGV